MVIQQNKLDINTVSTQKNDHTCLCPFSGTSNGLSNSTIVVSFLIGITVRFTLSLLILNIMLYSINIIIIDILYLYKFYLHIGRFTTHLVDIFFEYMHHNYQNYQNY
jgi:hypothetical protein